MLGWELSQAAQDAVGDAVPLALGIHGRVVSCSTEIQGAYLSELSCRDGRLVCNKQKVTGW